MLRLRLRRPDRDEANGNWTGTLDSPRAIAGLNAFKSTFLEMSRASKSTDEANPFPTRRSRRVTRRRSRPGLSSAARSASRYPKLSRHGRVRDAEPHQGKTMPAFLGGSDLAIPVERATRTWPSTGSPPSPRRPQMKGIVEGEPPEHDATWSGTGQRAGGAAELVRPDREELDERRERERAPQHAHEDPHRQADRPAGRIGEHKITSILNAVTTTGARAVTSSRVPQARRCRRTTLRARRRRRLTGGASSGSAPYALIAPVVVVIGAILGYPVYFLAGSRSSATA